MMQLPDKWFGSNDGSLFLDVIDRLHLARIHPGVCGERRRLCGLKTINGTPPCQRFLDENLPDVKHPFPVAQCILDWENKETEGIFAQVQCQLGLLQAVPLSAQLVPIFDKYTLKHLENTVGLRLPWLRSGHLDNKPEIDPRREKMNEIFRDFRTEADVKEFVSLLESDDGQELCTKPRSVKNLEDLELKRLSPDEQEQHFLLVSDMEQSFFSLLFILAEANAHARECNSDSIKEVRRWIKGERRVLRSELCYTDLTLDESRREEEFLQNTKAFRPNHDYGDRRVPVWPNHFWRASTFKEAAHALGFVQTREGNTAEQITERFERLCHWLTSEEARCHPAFQVMGFLDSEPRPLVAVLKPYTLLSSRGASTPNWETLQSLCNALMERLWTVKIKTETDELLPLLHSAESLCRFRGLNSRLPGVRFNLPGEYLLRKGESISRNFFATPLSYTSDEFSPRPIVGSFAVGTLLDTERIEGPNRLRVQALRALLRAIVQFGIDQSQASFLTNYRRTRIVGAFCHDVKQIANALSKRWMVQPPEPWMHLVRTTSGVPEWLKTQQWSIVPFPDLIETSAKVIKLWCFHDDPKDVFTEDDVPKTMEELVWACWHLSKNTLKPYACKRFHCGIDEDVVLIENRLREVDNLWDGLFQVDVDSNIPSPGWNQSSRDNWMKLTRFMVSALMNCVKHGHPEREVYVIVDTDEENLRIVFKNKALSEEETKTLSPWLLDARSKISTMPLPGAISGQEIQEFIEMELGGSINVDDKTGEGLYYKLTFTVPLKRMARDQQ